jgi:uncharacterized membrane protein YeaQ/YmgE (transglycosylase-associated protein family)
MYIILWLIFGAFVGWIASVVMKQRQGMGMIANIIFGLIGSALGMWIVGLFGYDNIDTFSFIGFFVSIAGAAIAIAIFTVLKNE